MHGPAFHGSCKSLLRSVVPLPLVFGSFSFSAGGAGFGVEVLVYHPLSLSLGKEVENDKLSGEPQA